MNNNRHSSSQNLTNEQIQVILTGKFGDGCLAQNGLAKLHPEMNFNYYYATSSKYLEYVLYKRKLLGSLCKSDVLCSTNSGYKNNLIFKFSTLTHPQITEIAKESVEQSIERMDELGFSLWLYDDGSLHKKKDFYNLNTQAFDYEVNNEVIAPFLKKKFNIQALPTIERKSDGREFWYLRIKKFDGAFIVSNILSKYLVSCLSYKCIDQETITRWEKLKEDLANTNIDIDSLHRKTLSAMLKRY